MKANKRQAPIDARQVFSNLAALGLDVGDAGWSKVIGMLNALVHDCLNLDPKRVTAVVKSNQYQVLINFAIKTLKRFE